ncbi:MAG TPA: DUF6599 family protein [Thermodesulfobacteriota bacterium]|nr:DUF6599 family protein [Thermodesulfobacteriota bacterium]
MNARVTLPAQAAGWKWDGKDARYNARTLFQYINGAAELYLSYGFQALTVRRFEKPNRPPIALEVYEMASSEDAYGVFSFEHQDEPAGIGQGSEMGGGLLRFWKGKYFVSAYAEGEGPDVGPAILELGKSIAETMPSGQEPKILLYLPDGKLGLVQRNIRFLRSHILLNQRFFISHDNILQINRESQAVLATYVQGNDKINLLIVRYPDEARAADAFRSFSAAYMPDAQGKDRLRAEDKKWTLVRKEKENLLIVFGAPRESDAESLLKAALQKIAAAAR